MIFQKILLASAIACTGLCAVEWQLDSTQATLLTGKTPLQYCGKISASAKGTFHIRSNPPVYGRAESTEELNRTDNLLLEAVFLPENINGFRTLIWKGDRSRSPQQMQYAFSTRDGKLEFKFMDSQGNWHAFLTDQPVVQPGLWQYAAAVFNHGNIKLYLNGKEVLSNQSGQQKKLVANSAPVLIGTGNGPGGEGGLFYRFQGEIHRVRIADSTSHNPGQDRKLQNLVNEKNIQSQRDLLSEFQKLHQRRNKHVSATIQKATAPAASLAEKAIKANPIDLSAATIAIQNFSRQLKQAEDQEQHAKFFQTATEAKGFAAFTLPTGQGFKRNTPFYTLLQPAGLVKLFAAGRESESFQLILAASPRRETTLQITPTQFRTSKGVTFPATAIHWGEIRDITARTTQLGADLSCKDDPDYLGSWPDLIEDENPQKLSLAAGAVQPLLVRFDVPANTPAGIYHGAIQIKAVEGSDLEIPVELTIRNFSLPEGNSIPISFSFFKDFYKDWYGQKELTPQQDEYIKRYLLSYRLPPCNIYSDTLYPSLEEMQKYHLNFATAGYFNYKRLLSEEELQKLIEQYRPRLEAMKKAGFAEGLYLYTFDEIVGMGEHEKTFPAARQIMARFKQEFPWLKRLQTSRPHSSLLNSFDVWVPLFTYFTNDNQEFHDLQKKGVQFWWYPADIPYKPFPNFFLGYPLTDMRVIPSMTRMKNLNGILYWCINREWNNNRALYGNSMWDTSRWEPAIVSVFNGKKVYRNGMGNLVYPGPNGKMYASMRLENLRDGLEDYEYYALLDKQLGLLRKKSPTSGLIPEAEAVLKVPANVATDVNQYSHTPQGLMQQHDRLGEMIERVNGELKK